MGTKSKYKTNSQAMREVLEKGPFFKEYLFDRFLNHYDARERVGCIKEARAMLGVNLKQAMIFVDKYWN